MEKAQYSKVICIGGGPAGLTAGYQLSKANESVTVLEACPTYVGGISRTEYFKGFGFDIGGHRFFSKSKIIEQLWHEILPDDFIERPRKSRIFYQNKFFHYPLQPIDALKGIGILEASMCMMSFLKAKVFPVANPQNFEEWVSNAFGSRLFNIFFRTYTEKVWGMSCKDISADWAAQRIKGLNLWSAVFHGLFGNRASTSEKHEVIKTLINSFYYPRKGPGQLWEEAARKITAQGGHVCLGERVTSLVFSATTSTWTVSSTSPSGRISAWKADHVISSMPLRELILSLCPKAAPALRTAAEKLRYRDFLTVALIVKDRHAFDDNWLYIHDPSVKVGRIQNFKSWSPDLIPDSTLNCYGMEYFCFEGDGLWTQSDTELIALAQSEIEKIGLVRRQDFVGGHVVRQPKAYPVYDDSYAQNVAVIRSHLHDNYPNLHVVGRNGMHKYNNQDHAMMTALLTVKNILAGKAVYDVWQVNQDAEYHESGEVRGVVIEQGGRSVPQKIIPEAAQKKAS